MKPRSLLKDDNGLPFKVYHGSSSVTNLDEEQDTFFALSPAVANAYAMYYNEDYPSGSIVFSAYLEMNNPLMITREFLENFAKNSGVLEDEIEIFANNFEDSFIEERDIIIEYAKKNGHDSMIILEDSLPVDCMGGDWDLQKAYVVFSPKQIHFNLNNINEV